MATKNAETTTLAYGQYEGEKMVKIRLFKDSGKYANDVFVGRNGYQWLIKRGEEVEVPEGVALILSQSEIMDQQTATKIENAKEAAKEAASK